MSQPTLTPGERAILDAIRQSQEDTRSQIEVLAVRVSRVEDAFPESDPAGHRVYHEQVIAKQLRWDDAKHKLVMHVAGWGTLGVFGWLAMLIWEAIKMETKK